MITIKCRECGETFEVSNEWQQTLKKRGHTLPKMCGECRKLRDVVAESFDCCECGKQVVLDGLQVRRLGNSKVKCQDCRVGFYNDSHLADPTAFFALNGGER